MTQGPDNSNNLNRPLLHTARAQFHAQVAFTSVLLTSFGGLMEYEAGKQIATAITEHPLHTSGYIVEGILLGVVALLPLIAGVALPVRYYFSKGARERRGDVIEKMAAQQNEFLQITRRKD